jgi:hypothetical protein
MSNLTKSVLVFILVLIGPVMYVISRQHSLARAYAQVRVGDSTAAVLATMGQPQHQEREHPRLHAELEYRYQAWPLPPTWVIGFSGDKVIEKDEVRSP